MERFRPMVASLHRTVLMALLVSLALAALGLGSARAGTITNSVPVGVQVVKGTPQTFGLSISGASSNAVITKVEAQFDYTAYGGLEDFVSVRFDRGSPPGASGGQGLVALGNLPASPPNGGTYSWIPFFNWNGLSVNTSYYFRFTVDPSSTFSFGPTIHGIYVRVTYADVNPEVSVTPSSGPQGTTFSQPGTGFAPSSTASLYFSGPDGPSSVLGKSTDSNGNYSHSWLCNLCPAGTYSYYAVDDATGQTSNTVYFTVYAVNPQVSVSPSSGPQGTTFQEPGTGFTPNNTARLYFNGPDGPSTVTGKATNGSGAYTHSWLCNLCPAGTYSYYAVDDATGQTSNTVYFTVTVTSAGPTLLTPGPGASKNFPAADLDGHTITFEWSPIAGTTHYELFVDNDSGFASKEINQTSLSSGTTSYQAGSNFLPTGTYYWKVLACPTSGPCGESETRTFSVTYADWPAPVFVPWNRFYSATELAHCYRTGLGCSGSGYTFEKIEGYVSDRPFPGSVPLMRLYNPTQKSYRYVESAEKRDAAIIAGYTNYLGIAAYAYAAEDFGTVGLRHLYKGSPDYDDFLCISKTEIDNAVATYGFTDQQDGVPIAYVSPTGLANAVGHRRMQGSIGGIDSGTGAFRDSYAQQALAYHGYGPPFAFVLNYNSQNGMSVPISPGWSHSLYSSIVEGPNGDVVLKWGDGSESFFKKQPDGTFRPGEDGNYDKLTCVAPSGPGCVIDPVNRGYNLMRKDQSRLIFREIPVNATSAFVPSVALIRMEDRHGNATTISFLGDSGRIDWARDAAGRQLNFTYDAQYRLTRVTDTALGRYVDLDYDPAGNLWHFTDARRKVTTFTYDADHRLVTVTRPKGNTPQRLSYDDRGRVQAVVDGYNLPMVNVAYDTDFNGTPGASVTSPNVSGRRIGFLYGSPQAFQLTGLRDAVGAQALMSFSDGSNATLPTSVQDLNLHTTNYVYDAMGNVTRITNALGKIANFSYDAYNNLTSGTDFGSPTRTTEYHWSADGKRLEWMRDPLLHPAYFTYNTQGLIRSVQDARGHTTNYDYDGQLNLQSIVDPESSTTQFGYDAAGRRTSATDAKLKTTSYGYDENDNLTSVTDHNGLVVTLTYDDNNNLGQISYVRSGVTDAVIYGYDQNDRLTSVTGPWARVYQYTYNDAGDLKTRQDPRGQVTTYSYDGNGRLSGIGYQPDRSVSMTYDGNGNLKKMDESWVDGWQSWDYDALNRVTIHTNTFGQQVGYGYDDASNRTSVAYPGSREVTYGYDLAKRLESVSDWIAGSVSYGYDTTDNLQTISNSNGTNTTLGYDRAARLTSIIHRKSDSSTLASFSFGLDPVGNHTSETSTGLLPIPAEPASDVTYSITKDNRLQSGSDGTSYVYDENGNRTAMTTGAGTTTYSYDEENRLTGVSGPGLSLLYVYDGMGNRIARTEGSTVTRYVLDLNGPMANVLMETDGSDNPLRYYVHGQGLSVQITSGGQRYFYHTDSRGSVVAMTDAAENQVQRYVYDEFGAVPSQQGTVVNPFRYVGGWGVMAEPGGLQFMRARFYDERVGRFLTKDPIGFEGGEWNLSMYAGGNPVKNIDPGGQLVMGFFLAWKVYKVFAAVNLAIRGYYAVEEFKSWNELHAFACTAYKNLPDKGTEQAGRIKALCVEATLRRASSQLAIDVFLAGITAGITGVSGQ